MKGWLVTVLLMGCGGFAAAKDAPPRKIVLHVGDVSVIRVAGNPTTGFQWELKSMDRTIAEPVEPMAYRQDSAKAGMVGVGGTFSLSVRGVKPGKTEAVLVYRRSWEKADPLKAYKVKIVVRP